MKESTRSLEAETLLDYRMEIGFDSIRKLDYMRFVSFSFPYFQSTFALFCSWYSNWDDPRIVPVANFFRAQLVNCRNDDESEMMRSFFSFVLQPSRVLRDWK